MSKSYRRYEVLLPLRFNDGTRVPDELVVQTQREFRKNFGAVSVETQTIRGFWQYPREELSCGQVNRIGVPGRSSGRGESPGDV
jgi:hypothetical protein